MDNKFAQFKMKLEKFHVLSWYVKPFAFIKTIGTWLTNLKIFVIIIQKWEECTEGSQNFGPNVSIGKPCPHGL